MEDGWLAYMNRPRMLTRYPKRQLKVERAGPIPCESCSDDYFVSGVEMGLVV